MPDSEIYPSARGPVHVGPMEPGDVPGILALFRTVFGKDKREDVWRWQFQDNLVGTHVHVGREESGRIVSHFGSIPVRFWIRGKETVIGQNADASVHPDHRSGLRRRGLFSATGQRHVDWCAAGRQLLGMGLPVPINLRIGKRLIGYVPMQKIHLWGRSIEPESGKVRSRLEVAIKGVALHAAIVPRFSADLDALWLRVRDGVAAASPRDAAHMNWRYADCPEDRYHLVELRKDGGELVGVAVGVVGYHEAPDGVIADWFVDPEVPEARPALLDAIETMMARVHMKRVLALFNPVDPEARFLEERGYELVPTHYTLVSRSYDAELCSEDWLNRNWFYTLGDFDVV